MIKAIKVNMPEGDQINWSFDFSLAGTIHLKNPMDQNIPDWVRLDNHQCSACTLSARDCATCPVAEVIAQYAFELRDHSSYEKVDVEIYQKESGLMRVNNIPLQTVVGEIVRLAVFQYSCPIGRKVKSAMVELSPFPENNDILNAFAIAFTGSGMGEGMVLNEDQVYYFQSLQELFGNLCMRLEDVGKGDAQLNGVVMLHSLSTLFTLLSPDGQEEAL